MSNKITLKVLVVGPKGSGKTVLCKNIFSRDPEHFAFCERSDGNDKEFDQFRAEMASEGDFGTYPVRIHERVMEDYPVGNSQCYTVTVQIWDCCGDIDRMRSKLLAIAHNSVGCIIVYNPGRTGHGEQADQWYKEFSEILPNKCEKMMYAYKMPDIKQNPRVSHPRIVEKLRVIDDCNCFDKDSVLKMHTSFDLMLNNIIGRIHERRERQERALMGYS